MRSARIELLSKIDFKCFIFIYFLLSHCVPTTWRSLALTSIGTFVLSSKKVPTTQVRCWISRLKCTIILLVRILVQFLNKKSWYAISSALSQTHSFGCSLIVILFRFSIFLDMICGFLEWCVATLF